MYYRYENKRLECEKQRESLATFRGGGDSTIKDYAVENSILQYKLEKAEKQLMAAYVVTIVSPCTTCIHAYDVNNNMKIQHHAA